MSVTLRIGEPIPLSLTLTTDDPSKYVRAYVTDHLDIPIPGSPFLLTYDSRGRYKNYNIMAPAVSKYLRAEYVVYDDALFTKQSLEYSIVEDFYSLDDSEYSADPRLAFLDAPISSRTSSLDIAAAQQGMSLIDLVGTLDSGDDNLMVGVLEGEDDRLLIGILEEP